MPETPDHTLDILERAAKEAQPDKRKGAAFVNVDTRVLLWLISDSRRLNVIETQVADHDAKLDDDEIAPTGEDYNKLIEIVGSAVERRHG